MAQWAIRNSCGPAGIPSKVQYDYEAASSLRQWAKQRDVAIWLNTHAVTQALRMKHAAGHEYAGHPIPPSSADIEGGGKFVNRADDFMVIHRYIQHPTEWMYNHIHIKKVKEVETGGRPTSMEWTFQRSAASLLT